MMVARRRYRIADTPIPTDAGCSPHVSAILVTCPLLIRHNYICVIIYTKRGVPKAMYICPRNSHSPPTKIVQAMLVVLLHKLTMQRRGISRHHYLESAFAPG